MIEAAIGQIRNKMRRITRGRSAPSQALRWSAAAIRLAQKSFYKIRGGKKQFDALVAALQNFSLEMKVA
jgi:hypothetical protein